MSSLLIKRGYRDRPVNSPATAESSGANSGRET